MTGDLVMRDHCPVQRSIDVQDTRNTAQSRQDAVLLGDDGGRSALVGLDASVAGGIAGGTVLQQRVLQHGGNAAAVPVHVIAILPACFESSLAAPPTPAHACGCLPPHGTELWSGTAGFPAGAGRLRFLSRSAPVLSSGAHAPH